MSSYFTLRHSRSMKTLSIPASLAIHADPSPGGLDHVGPRFAGELRALIGVDDLGRAVSGYGFGQRIDAKVRRHRVRDPK
jgi:hypothetical protein